MWRLFESCLIPKMHPGIARVRLAKTLQRRQDVTQLTMFDPERS